LDDFQSITVNSPFILATASQVPATCKWGEASITSEARYSGFTLDSQARNWFHAFSVSSSSVTVSCSPSMCFWIISWMSVPVFPATSLRIRWADFAYSRALAMSSLEYFLSAFHSLATLSTAIFEAHGASQSLGSTPNIPVTDGIHLSSKA